MGSLKLTGATAACIRCLPWGIGLELGKFVSNRLEVYGPVTVQSVGWGDYWGGCV